MHRADRISAPKWRYCFALSCAVAHTAVPHERPARRTAAGHHRRHHRILPISSTGHLLIAERWLGQRSDLFNIAIQAGAILAVVLIYWKRLWGMLTAFLGHDAPAAYDPLGITATPAQSRDYAFKLLAAFGVTAVGGLLVKKPRLGAAGHGAADRRALIVGAFWMVAAEQLAAQRAGREGERSAISWTTAILVGIAAGGRRCSRHLAQRGPRSSSPCSPAPPAAPPPPNSRSWSASRPCSRRPATNCCRCSRTAASATRTGGARHRVRRLSAHRLRRGEVVVALHPEPSLHRVRGVPSGARHRPVAVAAGRQLNQIPPAPIHARAAACAPDQSGTPR